MKCQGKFVFRGIERKDAGVFKNERGEEIAYKESYVLLLDENTENGRKERKFKIAIDSPIIKDLQGKKLYEDIILEFDVTIYSSRVALVPVAVINK